jgi:hypothetical protein
MNSLGPRLHCIALGVARHLACQTVMRLLPTYHYNWRNLGSWASLWFAFKTSLASRSVQCREHGAVGYATTRMSVELCRSDDSTALLAAGFSFFFEVTACHSSIKASCVRGYNSALSHQQANSNHVSLFFSPFENVLLPCSPRFCSHCAHRSRCPFCSSFP